MTLLKAIGILSGLILIAFVVAAALVINFNQYVVLNRAEALARERPYCIEVADSEHRASYIQATRLSDLSWGRMHSKLIYVAYDTFYTFKYHAIMMLKQPDELDNWSYWAENFVPDIRNDANGQRWAMDHNPDCSPTLHFAKRLPP